MINIKQFLERNKNGLALGFISAYITLFILNQKFITISFLDLVNNQLTTKGISFDGILTPAGLLFMITVTLVVALVYNYSDFLKLKVKFTTKQLFIIALVMGIISMIGARTDLFASKVTIPKILGGAKITGLGAGVAGFVAPLFLLNPWLGVIALVLGIIVIGLPGIIVGTAIYKNFNLILILAAVVITIIFIVGGRKRG